MAIAPKKPSTPASRQTREKSVIAQQPEVTAATDVAAPPEDIPETLVDDKEPVAETTAPSTPVKPEDILVSQSTVPALEAVCTKYQIALASAPTELVLLQADLDKYCSTMAAANRVTPEDIAEGYRLLQSIFSQATGQHDPSISEMCIDLTAVYFSRRAEDVFSTRLIGRNPGNQQRNSHIATSTSTLIRFFTVASKAVNRAVIKQQIDVTTLMKNLFTAEQRRNVAAYIGG